MNNNTAVLAVLLRQPGIQLDATKGCTGDTALFIAARHNHVACVLMLLKAGANPNYTGCGEADKITPCYAAAGFGCTASLRVLLRHGADPRIARFNGTTPICAAAKHKHRCAVELCLLYGGSLSPAFEAFVGDPIVQSKAPRLMAILESSNDLSCEHRALQLGRFDPDHELLASIQHRTLDVSIRDRASRADSSSFIKRRNAEFVRTIIAGWVPKTMHLCYPKACCDAVLTIHLIAHRFNVSPSKLLPHMPIELWHIIIRLAAWRI